MNRIAKKDAAPRTATIAIATMPQLIIDSRDPHPRADPLEDQIARHFENRVADEEQSRAEAEHRFAESKLAIHLQRREADVDSIEVRHQIEHEQKRDQPASRLRQRRIGKARLCGGLEWAHLLDLTIIFNVSHSAPGTVSTALHALAAKSDSNLNCEPSLLALSFVESKCRHMSQRATRLGYRTLCDAP